MSPLNADSIFIGSVEGAVLAGNRQLPLAEPLGNTRDGLAHVVG
jgi:hypothetical protein